jgi:hypothetical protein
MLNRPRLLPSPFFSVYCALTVVVTWFSIRATYFGGPGFDSQLGERLFRLRFLPPIQSNAGRQCLKNSTSFLPHPCPHIIHNHCPVRHSITESFLRSLQSLSWSRKTPPSAFYGTRRFITVFTRARHWSLFWARCIQFKPSQHISLRSILILSSHVHLHRPMTYATVKCLDTHIRQQTSTGILNTVTHCFGFQSNNNGSHILRMAWRDVLMGGGGVLRIYWTVTNKRVSKPAAMLKRRVRWSTAETELSDKETSSAV